MSVSTNTAKVEFPPTDEFGDLSETVVFTLDDGDSISAVSTSASWITATIGGYIEVSSHTPDSEDEESDVTDSREGTVTWTTANGDATSVTVFQYGYAEFSLSDSAEKVSVDNSAQTVGLPTSATCNADESLEVTQYDALVSAASGDGSWVSVNADSWTADVDENTGSGRSAVLYLVFCAGERLGNCSATLVQSSGEESITLDSSKLTFAYSGGTESVSFSTTGGESISSYSCSADWVTVAYDNGEADDDDGNYSGTITVTVSSNTYGAKRTATITFTGALYSSATITVTQDEGPYFITLGSENVELDCGANSEVVRITDAGDSVTLPLTASYDDASDWLTVVVAERTITIYATANTDSSLRTATVTLTDGNASVTLTVVQAGAPSRENLRLIPMQCGDDESYVLLFRDNPDETACMLDIYDAQTRKLYQTIDETPFPVGHEREIRYVQSFDVMYFAQGQTYPCKLVRDTNDDAEDGENEYVFSFEDVEFTVEPIMEWDIDSEHVLKVFAQPDADQEEDGVYPAGSIRSVQLEETVDDISYNYESHDGNFGDSWSDRSSVEITLYAAFTMENYSSIVVGDTVTFSGSLTVTITNVVDTNGDTIDEEDGDWVGYFWSISATDYKGTDLSDDAISMSMEEDYDYDPEGSSCYYTTTITLGYANGRVSSVDSSSGTVYLKLGTITLTPEHIEYGEEYLSAFTNHDDDEAYTVDDHFKFSSDTTSSTIVLREEKLYVVLSDVSTDVEVTDTRYYSLFSGVGSGLALTIDGGNDNENVEIGQWIALKYKNNLYESQLWDYDTYPEGTETITSSPALETEDVLASKEDYKGNELRPDDGGGYGFSSDWKPVRGEINLKTEGTWSGVIVLQQLDANNYVSEIAKITSENGLSNTDLSREVSEFGCSVRVGCTRREYAYETMASVTGDGDVYYRIVQCDTGCQWTLTSTDIQTAYVVITGKKTLSTGESVYIVDVKGGISEEFSTTTYALGAWSTANGYPEQITIFQERMVYGCNKQKPTTLWLSKTNYWDDFETGSEDTSAMNFTMQSDKYDRIRWMLALKTSISIGTDYGEWQFGESNGGVVTPDSARFINTSSIGSTTNISAAVMGQALIMVKTGARQLHRIDYNTLSEESAGTQLSLLSSHLFDDDEIVDMMVVRSPTNTLYCLHDSGKLTSFTYEPEYSVSGFAQHSILDGVVSACVVRLSGIDIVSMVVKNGDAYVLGEINPQSDIYLDDGESYTSELIPTPFAVNQQTGAYGTRNVFAGVDVYLTEGTQFEVCLPGGNWTHVEVGYNTDNTLPEFDLQKVTIPVSAGWEDEAVIDVRTDYAGPFVVAGIGVNIRKGK